MERIKFEQQLQKVIDSKSSFMSNAKWKFLFSSIQQLPVGYLTKIKLLLEDEERSFSIPLKDDYINENYLEAYWGVFKLKEIEWLFIPNEIRYQRNNRAEQLAPRIEKQDSTHLLSIFQEDKQFEYEVTKEGITIYGYK